MPASGPHRPATARLGILVRKAVDRHRSVLGAGPLVLAVSGGADSLAMLFAVATLNTRPKRDLIVAHFSHGIRRRAERGEERLVHRLAEQLGLPFAHEQAYLRGDEASARDARYAFLARVATEHAAAAVLTAHTQDDQAETVLLRLTRGSGLRGAGAIREVSTQTVGGHPLRLLRPLLEATRGDTLATCAEWGIEPASDATNRSLRYARNRIRRRVLPDLAAINPDVRAALAAFAVDAQEDEDLLQQTALASIESSLASGETSFEWQAAALQSMPDALRVRVLQDAWARLLGEGHALSRRQLASIDRVIVRGAGNVDLGADMAFVVEQERATLGPAQDPSQVSTPIRLPIPGNVRFGGWTIVAAADGTAPGDDNPLRAVLDAAALSAEVQVRSRKPGDRFHPMGMPSEVRLQDLLVNAKVPRSRRDELPLVTTDRGIAWVCGVRIAEWAKVTPSTGRIVVVEARREAG